MDDREPCDTCSRGIAKFRCYDKVRRCPVCITKLIAANRWNERRLPKKKPLKRKPERDKGQDSLF